MKCSECNNDAISSGIQMCEDCIGEVIKSYKSFWNKYKLVEVKKGCYEFKLKKKKQEEE